MSSKLERVVEYKIPGPSRKTMIISILLGLLVSLSSVWILPVLNSFFEHDPSSTKKFCVEIVKVEKKAIPEKIYQDQTTSSSSEPFSKPVFTKSEPLNIKLPNVIIPLEMNAVKISLNQEKSLKFTVVDGLAPNFVMAGVANLIFKLDEVDQVPIATKKMSPFYPFRAKRRGIEGEVVIELVINKTGLTEDIRVLSAEPIGYFEDSVIKAVEKWEFKPAMKEGEAVAVKRIVPIKFSLDN